MGHDSSLTFFIATSTVGCTRAICFSICLMSWKVISDVIIFFSYKYFLEAFPAGKSYMKIGHDSGTVIKFMIFFCGHLK